MDPLSIISAIASVTQLVQVIHRLSCGTLDLIARIHGSPEEIRRLKLTLESIKAKLEIIALAFAHTSNESWLSHDMCVNLEVVFVEVQQDVEAVADIIKAYTANPKAASSLKKRLHYQLCDHKPLEKCLKHLKSSEKNLQRVETSIHMYGHLGPAN